MFIGISIVCDDYFVPTLETIVDKLQMSDDTAGATWLAAGGSAPGNVIILYCIYIIYHLKSILILVLYIYNNILYCGIYIELFTSFIGIFIAKSDVGFGTIVGSAVFNVLFVVGMCAFFTPGNLPLTWWPFARDLTYYIFCLGLLSLFFGGTSPGEIEWWESGTLFIFYIVYVIMMAYNDKIKAAFYAKFINSKATLLNKYQTKTELVQKESIKPANIDISFTGANNSNYSSFKTDLAVTVDDTQPLSDDNIPMSDDITSNNDDDSDDDDDSDGPDLSWPKDEGCFSKFMYLIKYPIMISTYMTLADVTKPEKKKYWPWTFVVSLLWLGAFAYFMVWWAVIVGHCWKVPGIHTLLYQL